jgi:hypothetical protein
VKAARDLVALAWSHWGLGNDYTARLVASELATNAVLACEKHEITADFRVRIYMAGCCPIIEVWDSAPEEAMLIPLSERSEHGRGLPLVAAMCRRWWMDWEADGWKVVGAELAVAA